jgi:hypothetical protein
MAVRCSWWSFGIFFPFWYVWTRNNLATLFGTAMQYFCLTHKKSTLILATIFRSIKQVFAYPLHHSAQTKLAEKKKKNFTTIFSLKQCAPQVEALAQLL